MSSQNLFEKLELIDQKNILIQGLPSSIEKQFSKVSYAKSVTPLLKVRKIEFALVFAVNQNQLSNILGEIFPALQDESKLWIAFPKRTSKIVSDLNRDCSWQVLNYNDFESDTEITLDHVWTAMLFQKQSDVPQILSAKQRATALAEMG